MFSEEELERIKEIIALFNSGANSKSNTDRHEKAVASKNTVPKSNLNPSEILVLAGLLSGALEVSSIFVGRDQVVEVSLVGSLRRPTQTEIIMNQIGKCSFEEVIQAILKNMK